MIDYEETHAGDEAILFIHGIGASRWMWWQQAHAFSGYQVILVDLPGHGKSVSTPWVSLADTAEQIARHVIKDRMVHVVGLSLGGHLALELVKHHPGKIRSAFISGITVRPMSSQFLLKMQSWLVQRGIRNEHHLARLAREHYQLPPDKVSEFMTNYRLLTRKTYEAIWKEVMQYRLDESYSGITTPCMFVAGDQESRSIRESVEIAPRCIPNAEGRLVPDAQHVWSVQKADQFNHMLREWLRHHSE